MPEWLVTSLITLAVALVGSGGVWLGAVSSSKAAKRTGEHTLIDQLQEELNRYRMAADARATAQDERMTRLDGLVDGYRSYVHVLRAHIYDGKTPPPPEWPESLPR